MLEIPSRWLPGLLGLTLLSAPAGAADGTLGPGGGTGPDIKIGSSDSPDPVRPGSQITYTIDAINNGPGTPASLILIIDFSSGTTFVSASGGSPAFPDPDVGAAGGQVNHTFPGVPPDNYVTMTVVVMVDPGTSDGTVLTSSAVAGCSQELGSDPEPNNHNASITTTVARQADISTTKTESAEPVTPGTHLTYTITATNDGPDTPGTIQIQDDLPNDPNVTFVSATGGSVVGSDPLPGECCGIVLHEFSGVAQGGTVVLTVVVAINDDTPNDSMLYNSATSSSSLLDPDLSDNQVLIDTRVAHRLFLDGFETNEPGDLCEWSSNVGGPAC